MIEFLDIRDIIAIFGLFTGFGYYVLSVRGTKRNQQLQLETRQAQLYMSLYNDFKNKDFQNDFYVAMEFEFKDFDDFIDFNKRGRVNLSPYGLYQNNMSTTWTRSDNMSNYPNIFSYQDRMDT